MRKLTGIFAVAFMMIAGACGLREEKPQAKDYPDMESVRTEAKELYEKEDYRESLEKYLNAVESNPQDMDALLGVIRCQMALENYDIAVTDICELIDREPQLEEAYELYLEVGEKTDNIWYKINAVKLADRYNVESILSKIPASPEADFQTGVYDNKLTVNLSSPVEDAKIYYSYRNTDYGINTGWCEYTGDGIFIMNGEGIVESYLVKDDMPSLVINNTYKINYEGTEVSFVDEGMENYVRNMTGHNSGSLLDTDCYQITSISLSLENNSNSDSEPQIKSLVDLDKMPLLSYIYISGQGEIEDFSPVAKCKNLKSFYTWNTGIKDISFVKNMKNLNNIGFDDEDELEDVSPLLELHDLHTISIRYGTAKKLDEIILGNPDLSSLYILSASLSDHSILRQLEDLKYLELQGIANLDTEVLSSLTQLYSLDISRFWETDDYEKDYLDDLSFLDGMTGLTSLYLNSVRDPKQLEHIYGLNDLKYLYLYSSDEVTSDKEAMDKLKDELPSGCNINY